MTKNAIVKTVTVPISPDVAFDLFTARIGEWWPLDSHSVSAGQGAASRSLTITPEIGGAITEIDNNGVAHVWGHVEEFQPGRVLAITWHPGKMADAQTRVRVVFEADGEGTKVTLNHHGWEALAAQDAKMRDGYDKGWVGVLQRFESACVASQALR